MGLFLDFILSTSNIIYTKPNDDPDVVMLECRAEHMWILRVSLARLRELDREASRRGAGSGPRPSTAEPLGEGVHPSDERVKNQER